MGDHTDTPIKAEWPAADMGRLETISFVYAAAIAYGFTVLDFDSIETTNVLQWAQLLLYFCTFFVIGTDYALVREVYEKQKTYSKGEFLLDISIAFCFSRMLQSAAALYDKFGVTPNFRWWLWLGLIFALYTIWDLIELRKGSGLRWTFAANVAMLIICFGYFLLPSINEFHSLTEITHKGFAPVVAGLATLSLYGMCVWVWRWELYN